MPVKTTSAYQNKKVPQGTAGSRQGNVKSSSFSTYKVMLSPLSFFCWSSCQTLSNLERSSYQSLLSQELRPSCSTHSRLSSWRLWSQETVLLTIVFALSEQHKHQAFYKQRSHSVRHLLRPTLLLPRFHRTLSKLARITRMGHLRCGFPAPAAVLRQQLHP
jgi:hypothetical protein